MSAAPNDWLGPKHIINTAGTVAYLWFTNIWVCNDHIYAMFTLSDNTAVLFWHLNNQIQAVKSPWQNSVDFESAENVRSLAIFEYERSHVPRINYVLSI